MLQKVVASRTAVKCTAAQLVARPTSEPPPSVEGTERKEERERGVVRKDREAGLCEESAPSRSARAAGYHVRVTETGLS